MCPGGAAITGFQLEEHGLAAALATRPMVGIQRPGWAWNLSVEARLSMTDRT
jgi:hypothetical protein